jgi:hypothetical protein
MIPGGWEYIGAAYAFAYGTLLLYGVRLFLRYRRLGRPEVPHGKV